MYVCYYEEDEGPVPEGRRIAVHPEYVGEGQGEHVENGEGPGCDGRGEVQEARVHSFQSWWKNTVAKGLKKAAQEEFAMKRSAVLAAKRAAQQEGPSPPTGTTYAI